MFAFPPGPRALLRAIATIRRETRGAAYDVVHAHFGLAALPALAARAGPVVVTLHGNDLFVRRSRLVTRARAAADRAPRRRLARVQPQPAGRGHVAARRGAARRHLARALPADPARRGARAARARPRRPVPAVPARSRAAAEAVRPRARGGGRRAAAHARVGRTRRGAVLDQRRQRGARAVAGRGLRAVGDRGARLRRAGVRHAGRHPSRRAARHRGSVLRGVGRRAVARSARAGRRGGRPAGRRTRPRGAVLGRPHGRLGSSRHGAR